MRLITIVLCVFVSLACVARSAAAQEQQFPFKAKIGELTVVQLGWTEEQVREAYKERAIKDAEYGVMTMAIASEEELAPGIKALYAQPTGEAWSDLPGILSETVYLADNSVVWFYQTMNQNDIVFKDYLDLLSDAKLHYGKPATTFPAQYAAQLPQLANSTNPDNIKTYFWSDAKRDVLVTILRMPDSQDNGIGSTVEFITAVEAYVAAMKRVDDFWAQQP